MAIQPASWSSSSEAPAKDAWTETAIEKDIFIDITDGGTNYDDPLVSYDDSGETYDGIEFVSWTDIT